ncbi:lipopolysaccharide biosynthesis protein [Acuticoccus sediminis]|uniref:Lipopolysaccharide biosynthesis protein n=1 Tax=Acuticoccus sediminis TaxID=2184697 RepID=A0A8B2P045_9HYPH|nr:lipopolysaccharide biosynthesis protein [Acuticoccus sediminis]RAI03835.1 lipopolysaccharide biosynthesis protein [Acuticoccus sediminis]
MSGGSLGRVALKGGAFTGLAQIGKISITMGSVVVLARLLNPTDFGLVAAITPILAFMGLFQNLGLQQAIVQRKEVDRALLNQAFWISAGVGLAAMLIIFAVAPYAAVFYDDARISGLMRTASASLLIGSLGTVPIALLSRRLRFGVLAIYEFAIALTGFLAAVAGALAGLGSYALVVATLTGAAIGLAVVWSSAPFRPAAPPRAIDGALLKFGANLTGFNLVNFFARNADNVLIGRYIGLDALGLYDRAYKLMLFPIQNINQPLSRLMVPLLSRISDDKARFRAIYRQVTWTLGLVIMPGIATLAMCSQEAISILFGPGWAGVGPIFAWLAIASFVQPVTGTNGWIFICQGRTDIMFRLGVYTSLVTVAAFVVGLNWGAVGVAAAYAVSAYALRLPVLLLVVGRLGPVRPMDLGGIVLLLGGAAGASALALPLLADQTGAHGAIATLALAGVLNYALALVAVLAVPSSRRTLLQVAARLRDAIRGQSVRGGALADA